LERRIVAVVVVAIDKSHPSVLANTLRLVPVYFVKPGIRAKVYVDFGREIPSKAEVYR
jgi:hypothetical protein